MSQHGVVPVAVVTFWQRDSAHAAGVAAAALPGPAVVTEAAQHP